MLENYQALIEWLQYMIATEYLEADMPATKAAEHLIESWNQGLMNIEAAKP